MELYKCNSNANWYICFIHKFAKKQRVKKMLSFDQLSFWERQEYLEDNTFVIVGAGLVGMSTALALRERFPNEKILILERGYLPTGASTKNAGFACFGSPTEILDDLSCMAEQTVWQTIALRIEGLQKLKERIGLAAMDFDLCGSWDLLSPNTNAPNSDELSFLNSEFERLFGFKEVYCYDATKIEKSGFKGFDSSIKNQYEGSINTGKLMHTLHQKCVAKNIRFLFSTTVLGWAATASEVSIETTFGLLRSSQLFICTNGFTQHLFKSELKPARAQVIITKPLSHHIRGTFHSDRGYYYFRDIGNRILLGGGRHLDISTETTEEFQANSFIYEDLINKLREEILPHAPFEIDYGWSGIMGMGQEKQPIIRSVNKNVHAGVRMGGMGVAIASAVGDALSKLA